ncbi:RING-type domain-containing protein [Chloropicon primus]|uniref:RING-type domain-containing protein n=1 Tax=Chloropicon primus TaxID=1764295 RepID=A0A5B8MH69_9CHLO|nr:hypothetical protein A3770_02p12180 [Chloropicon primus]UPQ97908.1 RING-type domain-containing protein [Chloropicon primus]|eukprot:QDZ18700.1 hypothetical protein A3770_02p12180 [Chloropicon primus]
MSSLLLLATLLPVVLNFGCILVYLVYQKCRARTQEEGSADWDDVIWFRVNARDGRSLFSGVREPGTVTPRRRSLNSMKYPPDTSEFERCCFGDLDGACDTTCCICLEEYDSTSKLTRLPCKHWMHSECIEKWFNRDVTCPLCKEIAIERPYSDVVLPIDAIDESGDSGTSNNSRRSNSRRPSLSRLIRDTLDQHAEVYFMYNRNDNSSSRIMNFMRNLLQTNRSRRERRQNRGSVDEDVPPVPTADELEQDITLQAEEEPRVVEVEEV